MNVPPAGTGVFVDALGRYGAEVGFGRMSPQDAAEAFFAEVEPDDDASLQRFGAPATAAASTARRSVPSGVADDHGGRCIDRR